MEIKMYTVPGCGYCKTIKQHLKKRGFEVTEIDLSVDEDGQNFMDLRGYTGVPVTVIGEQEIVGFKMEDIDEALDTLQKNS